MDTPEITSRHLESSKYENKSLEEMRQLLEQQDIEIERLKVLAYTDKLTGAYNRHAFSERIPKILAEAEANGEPLSIIVFDLDRFKELNDLHGHQAGDKALQLFTDVAKNLALRTQNNIRHKTEQRVGDEFYRWGGDEFVLVLRGATTRSAEEIFRTRLQPEYQWWQQFESAYLGEKGNVERSISPEHHPTLSGGIVGFIPGTSPEELLRRADDALYASKEKSRNTATIWTPDMPRMSTKEVD